MNIYMKTHTHRQKKGGRERERYLEIAGWPLTGHTPQSRKLADEPPLSHCVSHHLISTFPANQSDLNHLSLVSHWIGLISLKPKKARTLPHKSRGKANCWDHKSPLHTHKFLAIFCGQLTIRLMNVDNRRSAVFIFFCSCLCNAVGLIDKCGSSVAGKDHA